MKQFVKSALIGLLTATNKFPTRVTRKADLAALLARLHPRRAPQGLIRLGPDGDGGYLVPNDLDGIQTCFSPGVCEISGFEKDCAERGMKVFMADRSVDGAAAQHPLFHFTKKYVGVTTNDDFMTMDNWIASSLPENTSDLLLQIDIEGFEYEVFLAMSDALMQRFRIIVVEFHQVDMLWSNPFFRVASRAFDKILQTHACVHIHPNNCNPALRLGGLEIPRVMEMTFLRRDRLGDAPFETRFPHPRDFDNTPKKPVPLPACWYSSGK